MSGSLLHDRYPGTDDDARAELRRTRGAARWLATPWPYAQLAFAAVAVLLLVGVVLISPARNNAATVVVVAIAVVAAAVEATPAVWTLRHRDRAVRILSARRTVSDARVRRHPWSFLVAITAGMTLYGYARPHHAGVGERLAFAAVGLVVGLSAGVYRVRRSRKGSQS